MLYLKQSKSISTVRYVTNEELPSLSFLHHCIIQETLITHPDTGR